MKMTMKMQLVFPYALTRNPLEIHIAIEGLQGVIEYQITIQVIFYTYVLNIYQREFRRIKRIFSD